MEKLKRFNKRHQHFVVFLSTSAGCCVCCLEAGLRSATTQETNSGSLHRLGSHSLRPAHGTQWHSTLSRAHAHAHAHRLRSMQKYHTSHFWSAYLSFPVLLLGFLRKDWFGPERVDMERGEARENVDGGVLGIFFPRCPIHFFCSSVVRASRSMSRAEVTS